MFLDFYTKFIFTQNTSETFYPLPSFKKGIAQCATENEYGMKLNKLFLSTMMKKETLVLYSYYAKVTHVNVF